MGDRRTERALALGPLNIHMDPLEILGASGELIDPVLVDGQPFRNAEVAPDELVDRAQAITVDGHVLPSPGRVLPTLEASLK